jgi:hypothetical protein
MAAHVTARRISYLLTISVLVLSSTEADSQDKPSADKTPAAASSESKVAPDEGAPAPPNKEDKGAPAPSDKEDKDGPAPPDTDKPEAKVTPTISTTTPATIEEGNYVVKKDGKVCIRATFKADFKVKYAGKRPDKRLYVQEEVFEMPEDKVETSGTCLGNKSTLILTWVKGNFSLQLDFTPQKKSDTGDYGWSTSEIRFTVDTRDSKLFNKPLHPGKYTSRSKPGHYHFWTPRNHSFSCTTRQMMTLHEYNTNHTIMEENLVKVSLYMSEAQIQAYDLQDNGKYSEGASCEADIFHSLPKQNIVPIVVAACLAGIILIIIVAYFISKNIGQSAYRPMD